MFRKFTIISLLFVLLVSGVVLLPTALAATSPVTISCAFGDGGDLLDRGFYITFPGDTLDTVTLQYSSDTTETFEVTLTARLDTYDGTLVGQASASFAGTGNRDIYQPITFNFGGAAVPADSLITFTQTLTQGTFSAIFYNVGSGGLGVMDGACPGFTETEGTTPPLDTFRRDTVGATVTGSLTTDDGGVPDNPSQAGEHANSHACEDNPGKANEHRPPNVPPCR